MCINDLSWLAIFSSSPFIARFQDVKLRDQCLFSKQSSLKLWLLSPERNRAGVQHTKRHWWVSRDNWVQLFSNQSRRSRLYQHSPPFAPWRLSRVLRFNHVSSGKRSWYQAVPWHDCPNIEHWVGEERRRRKSTLLKVLGLHKQWTRNPRKLHTRHDYETITQVEERSNFTGTSLITLNTLRMNFDCFDPITRWALRWFPSSISTSKASQPITQSGLSSTWKHWREFFPETSLCGMTPRS